MILKKSVNPILIRDMQNDDLPWAASVFNEFWGSTRVVSFDVLRELNELKGLVAWEGDQRIGLLTYIVEGNECEIVTLNAIEKNRGVGSRLIEEVVQRVKGKFCNIIKLVTTNDNIEAMLFYQKKGFRFVEVRKNSIQRARILKPEIPEIGNFELPILEEIVFSKELTERKPS